MSAELDVAGDNRRFARRFFTKVAQVGTIGGATLALCAVLFLAAVNPSLVGCSTWLVPVPKGASAPGWILAPMVALWAVSMCFGAIRWGWFARLRARGAGRTHVQVPYAPTIDFGWLLIAVMATSALACATPILVALASCHSAH